MIFSEAHAKRLVDFKTTPMFVDVQRSGKKKKTWPNNVVLFLFLQLDVWASCCGMMYVRNLFSHSSAESGKFHCAHWKKIKILWRGGYKAWCVKPVKEPIPVQYSDLRRYDVLKVEASSVQTLSLQWRRRHLVHSRKKKKLHWYISVIRG